VALNQRPQHRDALGQTSPPGVISVAVVPTGSRSSVHRSKVPVDRSTVSHPSFRIPGPARAASLDARCNERLAVYRR
jgi:hypothetical protein